MNSTIRVNLSGDGTTIGKRLHVVNFAYTILDEGDLAHSYEGNHCLAIFRAPENYECLKSALMASFKKFHHFNSLLCVGSNTELNITWVVIGNS